MSKRQLEIIKDNDALVAIVIRDDYDSQGIEFFTPGEFSQQLAYMKRPAGYTILPHIHRKVERRVEFTQEVLFVKKGSVKVDLYSEKKQLIKTVKLVTGDVILLASGGHGFTMLEKSVLIEVKQGPYADENDKERFEPK